MRSDRRNRWMPRGWPSCAAVLLGVAGWVASPAQALEAPTGPVVLTIEGAITQTNRGT